MARIESFIARTGLDDAVARAEIYGAAGADAIVVHSRSRDVDEIAAFSEVVTRRAGAVPVLAIPTTFFQTDKHQLHRLGVSGAIYANQVLRAGVRATTDLLDVLARHGTTAPAEPALCSLTEIFDLVDTHLLIGDNPWRELDTVWNGADTSDAADSTTDVSAPNREAL